jgi:hypothetical protein
MLDPFRNIYDGARGGEEITHRLSAIFLRDAAGRRPVYRGTKKLQRGPQWKDYILFCEYFHDDNGAGLAASHHTS